MPTCQTVLRRCNRLDLEEPALVEDSGDHDRERGTVLTKHLSANDGVRLLKRSITQEDRDFDEAALGHTGFAQYRQYVAPCLTTLFVEAFRDRTVLVLWSLATHEHELSDVVNKGGLAICTRLGFDTGHSHAITIADDGHPTSALNW